MDTNLPEQPNQSVYSPAPATQPPVASGGSHLVSSISKIIGLIILTALVALLLDYVYVSRFGPAPKDNSDLIKTIQQNLSSVSSQVVKLQDTKIDKSVLEQLKMDLQ